MLEEYASTSNCYNSNIDDVFGMHQNYLVQSSYTVPTKNSLLKTKKKPKSLFSKKNYSENYNYLKYNKTNPNFASYNSNEFVFNYKINFLIICF